MNTNSPEPSGQPGQPGAGPDAGIGAGTGPAPHVTPPPFSAPPGTPPSYAEPPTHEGTGFFAAIRRTGLYRSDQRWVGGVAGGLAGRFGIDPLLVRGIFGVSCLLFGLGLIAYGAAWALLPEQRDGRIHLEETIRGRFDAALLGAIAFVIIGLARGDGSFGHGTGLGWFSGFVGVAVVIVIIVLLVSQGTRHSAGGSPQPGPYGPFPGPGAPTGTFGAPTGTFGAPAGAFGAPPMPAPARPATTGPAVQVPPPGPYYSPGYTPAYAPPAPHVSGYAPNPRQAAAPPVAIPRPRVPGPGSTVVGAVVALGLIALAALLGASRLGRFDGEVALTTVGAFVVLLGLAIIVSGLRGRRSGVLGFFAIMTILICSPLAVGHNQNWEWTWTTDGAGVANNADVRMTTRVQAEAGYSAGLGDTTVDLTDVPLTSETLTVPLHVGVGTLVVIVPKDASVTANVKSGVGDVTWQVGGERQSSSGVGAGDRHFASPEVTDGTDPQLTLDVNVGAGDITIKESR